MDKLYTVMNSKMPKGVEHSKVEEHVQRVKAVMNSKMPKGVEHLSGNPSRQGSHRDEFEDAERR